ncbi:MAG: hypothetical protein IPP27_18740 [Bacteroidetes bacterium]|nr:hypothetical protein [Bacteroidota bacterium]
MEQRHIWHKDSTTAGTYTTQQPMQWLFKHDINYSNRTGSNWRFFFSSRKFFVPEVQLIVTVTAQAEQLLTQEQVRFLEVAGMYTYTVTDAGGCSTTT